MLCRSMRMILVPSLIALGCGGGDDDGPGPGTGGDDGDGNQEDGADDGADDGLPTAVNGELTGKLYFDAPVDYVELDLSSSRRVVIRNRASDVEQETTPSADAQEFVATDDPLSESLGATDLLLLDRDGTTRVGFEFGESLGRPRLSADGSRIALTLNSVPTVLDRDGQIVAQLDAFEDATDLVWAPDGRLVIAFEDSIHLVDRELAGSELLARFPGDRPDFLSVSPDGSRLAFDLGDADLGENHVFLMNIDGTGVTQLTTSELNEDGAAWSPDGRWIIVRHGIVYSIFVATCPEVWAVPSDATNAQIGGEGGGGAFMVREIEDGEPRNICAFSPPEWRAALEPLASAPGTPPAGDGLNAGLSGRLVFEGFVGTGDDSGGFVELPLGTGSARRLPLPPGVDSIDASDPFVSHDGGELAFVQDDPDSGELGFEQVTIQRLDATREAAFEQPEFFSGQPKLSPDGRLVAVEWHSIELGDEGGVRVVTVFDRAGAVQQRWTRTDEWDWLPDGRLVLADRNRILVASAALDQVTELVELTDDIADLQASPDGTRLAFSMNGHVWTLGVDGGGLRRMTSGRTAVTSPAWSPDGRALAVQLDAVCPEVYIVPADAERLSVGDSLVPAGAALLRQIEEGDPRNVCAFSLMNWRN